MAPAQVFGDEERIDALGQPFQLRQMGLRQRIGRTDRQSHAMQADGVQGAEFFQIVQRRAAIAEEIFAVHFQPAHVWRRRQHVLVVRRAQADAGTMQQKIRPTDKIRPTREVA